MVAKNIPFLQVIAFFPLGHDKYLSDTFPKFCVICMAQCDDASNSGSADS